MLWESSSTYLKFKKEAGLRMGEWDQQEGNQRGAYQLNEYFLLCQLRAKPIMRGQVAQDAYLRIKCVCVCVSHERAQHWQLPRRQHQQLALTLHRVNEKTIEWQLRQG